MFLRVTQWQTHRPCEDGGVGGAVVRLSVEQRGGGGVVAQQMVCSNTRRMLSYLLDMACRDAGSSTVMQRSLPPCQPQCTSPLDCPCPSAPADSHHVFVLLCMTGPHAG